MSDRLVEFQNWIAQYPSWMVAGGVGFVVVVAVILIWKAMRIAITALIIAVVVAGGWYVWEKVSSRDQATAAPASAPKATTAP